MNARDLLTLRLAPLPLALPLTLFALSSIAACADDSSGIDDDGMMDTGDDTDGEDPTGEDPTGDESGGSSGDPTDGDPTDGDPTDGDPTDGDPEPDTTAPTIVSISPADGDVGVLPDDVITVVFSEPMDKAATQAAYQSVDLPSAKVTMAWNPAGDTLTITPSSPLELAEGADLEAVEAKTYAIAITTVARDLAGNDLAEQSDVEFDTARRIFAAFEQVAELCGTVAENGDAYPQWFVAGDAVDPFANAELRAMASFDLAHVPEDLLVLEHASFRAQQIGTVLEPYAGLGDLLLEHVEFAALTDGFAADADMLGMLSNDAAPGERSLEILEAVDGDYEAGREVTQFRARFETATDWDSKADTAWFDLATLTLEVTYLVP